MHSVPTPTNTTRGQSLHNPITNPIDFKIGISNPYVVHAYEDTKNRYFGEPALRLRNLALIGNKSLHKWSPPPFWYAVSDLGVPAFLSSNNHAIVEVNILESLFGG